MVVLRFTKIVNALAFILLSVSQVAHFQKIVFRPDYEPPSNRDRPSSPTCGTYSCIPVSRCSSLRSQRNWRNIGQTCGYGPGSVRRVCCPRRDIFGITPRPPMAIPENTPPRTVQPPLNLRLNTIINTDCGQPLVGSIEQEYILGGQIAEEGAWPWLVAITRRTRSGVYTPWCTGFLIDRRHVLSAAHCFNGRMDNGLYSTRIGRVNQNEGDVFPISNIKLHEGYRNGRYYDDIAIITLTTDVNLPNVMPICLPDSVVASKDLVGIGTTVAGWGSETVDGPLSINLKQLSEIPVVPNQDCNKTFRDRTSVFRRQFPRGITSTFICAGYQEGEKDACGGDSGGPLMLQDRNRWYAIGIVSFGYSCGLPGVPGGYTRISSYLGWIANNIRN